MVKEQWSVPIQSISPVPMASSRASWSAFERRGGDMTNLAPSGASYMLSSKTIYWGQLSRYTSWPRSLAWRAMANPSFVERCTTQAGLLPRYAASMSRPTPSASTTLGRDTA